MMSRGELAGKRGASLAVSLSRRYQRQGLMKEALRAVIHELVQAEGLDYLHRGHFDFNLPSAKLQEKLGSPLTAVRPAGLVRVTPRWAIAGCSQL